MESNGHFCATPCVAIAKAEDWEPAMEVAWRTFLKYEAPVYGEEGTKNFLNFISDEKLFKMFQNGDYIVMVAKRDDKVVGVASVRTGNHLSLLFVDSAFHKEGYGRALLAAIQESVFKKTGSFLMTVNSAPYAVGFYEKMGFMKTDDWQRADGIEYLPMRIVTKI